MSHIGGKSKEDNDVSHWLGRRTNHPCGNLPLTDAFLEGKPERESSERTISASGGSGSLQMVLEPDTGRWGGFGGGLISIGERNEFQ